jgi:hypothetical protein
MNWWDDTDRGKPKYLRKNHSRANFFTTKRTHTADVSDPGLCGETTMTNHLRISFGGYILQFTKHWYDLKFFKKRGGSVCRYR